GGELLGAMANVKVDNLPHDVIVLDNGLIFIPCPKKAEHGKRRLIALIQSAPVVELAQRHRFVPYEEIAGATRTKSVPLRAELKLHNGHTLSFHETWGGELLTKDSRAALNAAINELMEAAQPA